MPAHRPHFTSFALTLAVGICTGVSTPATATVIADSVAQFSSVQGQNNWYYGYYSSTLNPTGFQQMANFDPTLRGGAWEVDFNLPDPRYWTSLWNVGGHPNSNPSNGGRANVEQWAVRRWVSNIDGTITISGNIGDLDTTSGANGIIGHIFVGNTQVYSATLNEADTVG